LECGYFEPKLTYLALVLGKMKAPLPPYATLGAPGGTKEQDHAKRGRRLLNSNIDDR